MKLFLLMSLVYIFNAQAITIDTSKYLGVWYEQARTFAKYQDNEPTKDGKKYSPCFNTTATYTLKDEKTINIKNSCFRKSEDKSVTEDIVLGIGYLDEKSQGDKLKIAFGPGVARFFMKLFTGGGADYWIYAIGPENALGQYSWSIVSGPKKDFIYFLSREKTFAPELKTEMLNAAKKLELPVDKLLYKQE